MVGSPRERRDTRAGLPLTAPGGQARSALGVGLLSSRTLRQQTSPAEAARFVLLCLSRQPQKTTPPYTEV